MIFQSALGGGHAWLGIVFLSLLALAFLGMASVLLPMLSGGPATPEPRSAERGLSILPPLALASGALVLGLYIPSFLADALQRAAGVLGG